jgi:hypothetical protein
MIFFRTNHVIFAENVTKLNALSGLPIGTARRAPFCRADVIHSGGAEDTKITSVSAGSEKILEFVYREKSANFHLITLDE